MGRQVRRVRVGVIGCGLIAQVMHLYHLHLMRDRFEVVALCDISSDLVHAVGSHYHIPRVYTEFESMLAEERLDAVMVLTGGSHRPPTVAAAAAGLHVFVEKPLCLAPWEGEEMIEAARDAGVVLMVGYQKRYDPAYERMLEEIADLGPPLLAGSVTLESPVEDTYMHYPLYKAKAASSKLARALKREDDALVASALPEADDATRLFYRAILLDSMVHEINALKGALGGPPKIDFSRIRADGQGVVVAMTFPGHVDGVSTWTNLPGLARYKQEISLYFSEIRFRLCFGSPFLRNYPVTLKIEAGDSGRSTSERVVTASYETAFARELDHFYRCVTDGVPCRTDGSDGLEDVRLLQEIALRAAPTCSMMA